MGSSTASKRQPTNERSETPSFAADAVRDFRSFLKVEAGLSPATIEAYTVMHARDGQPEQAIASCLLADGRRAWGTSTEADTLQPLLTGEWVGHPATLTPDGTLHL